MLYLVPKNNISLIFSDDYQYNIDLEGTKKIPLKDYITSTDFIGSLEYVAQF